MRTSLATVLAFLLMSAASAEAQVFLDRSGQRGSLVQHEVARIPIAFQGVWGSPISACRGAGVLLRIDAVTVGDLAVTAVRGFSDDTSAIEVNFAAQGTSQTRENQHSFLELSDDGRAMRVKGRSDPSPVVFHRCTSAKVSLAEAEPPLQVLESRGWGRADPSIQGVTATIVIPADQTHGRRQVRALAGAEVLLTIGCNSSDSDFSQWRFGVHVLPGRAALTGRAIDLAEFAAGVASTLGEPGYLILLDNDRREIARHIIYPTSAGIETGPLRHKNLERLVRGPARLRVETPRLVLEASTAGLQSTLGAIEDYHCTR